MKKFIYIGDPTQPPEAFEAKEAFGLIFEPGVATEVEDEAVIAKLEGNSHFAEEGSEEASNASGRKKVGRPRKSEKAE